MNVVIRNMEIPNDCLHCKLSYMNSDSSRIWIVCKITGISIPDNEAVKEGRTFLCPLKEAPDDIVHGKWIRVQDDLCECSACRKYWIDFGDAYDFNFCPHCGADMRGEDNG